jgi:hypothetical protein
MSFSKTHLILLLIISFNLAVYSQQSYRLYGKIYDTKTSKPIEYVTVKVADTTYGTTADKNGDYFLKLSPGAHKIIYSLIGYFSDTASIFIEDSNIERNIYLKPSEIMTETIEVLGEDPAYDIIRKAIKYKKEFRAKLYEYDYDAYTKYIIRSDQSMLKEDSLTEQDKYPIFAILESETKGYFKKPDKYKEIVSSKRETANIPRGIAIPYIVNFYDEVIPFGEIKITGPLADDALDYYEYKLVNTTSIDSQKVYKIEVIDGAGLFPLFKGHVYIGDSTYALMKVDLSNNEAALPFAVDAINYKQKFTSFDDDAGNNFWMPTDVQLYAEISLANVFYFTGEGFTIVSHYNLNKKAPGGTFDEYVIRVKPDAKKDSAYWKQNQLVKSSKEEDVAYKQIEKKTKERKGKFSFGLGAINFGQYINSNPLNYYRYNRVEGSHLQFNLDLNSFTRRISMSGYIGYGFSDKKTKYELNYTGRFLKDRSLRISAGIFRRLQPLGYNVPGFFNFLNTASALLDKRDFYDYYYASGWDFRISKLLVPQLGVSLRYVQEKQFTANKNTDYSFRKNNQPFRDNPPVNDAFQRTVGLGLTIDPNKYKFIDYGDGEESRFTETEFPVLTLGFDYSAPKLGSTYEFRKYAAELNGENYFNRLLNLKYKLGTVFYSGNVPYQSLAHFNSTSAPWDRNLAFKTMSYREYLGDKIYYLNLENDFANLLWSKIKFIRKWSLVIFANIAKSEITAGNYQLSSFKDFSTTDSFYAEAGFGIANIFDLIRLDFAWRLNNQIPGRNFNFSFTFLNF